MVHLTTLSHKPGLLLPQDPLRVPHDCSWCFGPCSLRRQLHRRSKASEGELRTPMHTRLISSGFRACAPGEFDAGVVNEQGQAEGGEPNCQSCSKLKLNLFGGKARVKGNGNCQKECGECERPSPHPEHGPVCWSYSANGNEDPNWTRNEDPDIGTVGGCGAVLLGGVRHSG